MTTPTYPEKPQEKRRFSLFSKPLKQCVDPLLRPVFKAQGTASSKLIGEWPQLVGKELAAYTLPVKLHFPKDKNSQGTLTIACSSAHALALQHLQPVIMERIAAYFGYPAVARILIEQRAHGSFSAPASPPRPPAKRNSAPARCIPDPLCLNGIDDPELREALSGLAKTFTSPRV